MQADLAGGREREHAHRLWHVRQSFARARVAVVRWSRRSWASGCRGPLLVRLHLRPEGPTVNSRRREPPERAPATRSEPQRGRQCLCLCCALPPLAGAGAGGEGFRRLTPPATDYRPFRAWKGRSSSLAPLRCEYRRLGPANGGRPSASGYTLAGPVGPRLSFIARFPARADAATLDNDLSAVAVLLVMAASGHGAGLQRDVPDLSARPGRPLQNILLNIGRHVLLGVDDREPLGRIARKNA